MEKSVEAFLTEYARRTVSRRCRFCGQAAPDAAAEPICNRDGLVGPHSYVDVPAEGSQS